MTPTATALATAFGLGCATSPVERMAEGWGGHNVLWRLRTTAGRWAIKQLGREIGPAPDAALAIESAAYAGGVPMPRPVPTVTGSCVAAIDGTRYRCHEWVDGTALPWHGHLPGTAAVVGGILAGLHRLRLGWGPSLAPTGPVFGAPHWAHLAERARAMDACWCAQIERAAPEIARLEAHITATWTLEGAIGSHRDLHPTNLLRVARGRHVLVDWDAAGPVVPRQEVACFALVFGDRGQDGGYDQRVVRAFIDGYRQAGGQFARPGPDDLAFTASGLLWWTEQNVRLALASPTERAQAELTANLLTTLSQVQDRLTAQASMLADSV